MGSVQSYGLGACENSINVAVKINVHFLVAIVGILACVSVLWVGNSFVSRRLVVCIVKSPPPEPLTVCFFQAVLSGFTARRRSFEQLVTFSENECGFRALLTVNNHNRLYPTICHWVLGTSHSRPSRGCLGSLISLGIDRRSRSVEAGFLGRNDRRWPATGAIPMIRELALPLRLQPHSVSM